MLAFSLTPTGPMVTCREKEFDMPSNAPDESEDNRPFSFKLVSDNGEIVLTPYDWVG